MQLNQTKFNKPALIQTDNTVTCNTKNRLLALKTIQMSDKAYQLQRERTCWYTCCTTTP